MILSYSSSKLFKEPYKLLMSWFFQKNCLMADLKFSLPDVTSFISNDLSRLLKKLYSGLESENSCFVHLRNDFIWKRSRNTSFKVCKIIKNLMMNKVVISTYNSMREICHFTESFKLHLKVRAFSLAKYKIDHLSFTIKLERMTV